jgi:hypothetical protein
LNRPAKPSLLKSLPREIRDRIWGFVLYPSTVVMVGLDVHDSRFRSDYWSNPLAKRGRTKYMNKLVTYYGTDSNNVKAMKDSEPPKCERVSFRSYFRAKNLLLVNKQFYEESKSILTDLQAILSSAILGNMLQGRANPEFYNVLADSKVYFNCHPFELYTLLDASPVKTLENITSIVLGEKLVLEKHYSTEWPSPHNWYTDVALPATQPWASNCEPSADDYKQYMEVKENKENYYNYYEYKIPPILKIIESRLPNLKVVALWAPTGNRGRAEHYYKIVVTALCRMVAASRIDKLELLYEYKEYSSPNWVSNTDRCKAFFYNEGVVTEKTVVPVEPAEADNSSSEGSASMAKKGFLVENRFDQRWDEDYDKGQKIWGIRSIKAVGCVERGDAREEKLENARIAELVLALQGLSKKQR